jgi:hypothetical protein
MSTPTSIVLHLEGRLGLSDGVYRRSICHRQRDVQGAPLLPLAGLRDGAAPHGHATAVHHLCQLADFIGLMQVWITKQQSVMSATRNEPSSMPCASLNIRRHPGGGEGSLDESGRHQTPTTPLIRTAFFEWRSATATRVSARTLQDGFVGTAQAAAHKADFDL